MKAKLLILFIGILAIILAACSDNNENTDVNEDVLQVIKADLEVPETADVNEKVELLTTVSYGDEKVTEADEVVYEIWEEGQKDNSFKLESINHGDGTYTATTSFDKDGIFNVQVHVTAETQHTMPILAITVGEGGHYEDVDDPSNGEHHDMDENEDHSNH